METYPGLFGLYPSAAYLAGFLAFRRVEAVAFLAVFTFLALGGALAAEEGAPPGLAIAMTA